MALPQPAADTRKRVIVSFFAAYVLYVVVILISGEAFNAASLVLGLALAGLIVWLAESRRKRKLEERAPRG